ncbi:MAG TPA: hypothetical protein VHG72_12280 [Polyangia bacterium]|nr:hypothetical protein [Polyangia bacterium]
MRILCVAALVFLGGCVDLSHICPYKEITQGVFGEVVDSNNTLEQNVEVDLYTTLNGAQDMLVASRQTGRGGYQFEVNPSIYMLCSKGSVCTTVTIPTGLVEVSAVDAASGLTWNAPVTVPPAQTIGPCTWGD